MGPFADGWDEAKVEAILARGDPDAHVRGQAYNAAFDINHFLGWRLRAPD